MGSTPRCLNVPGTVICARDARGVHRQPLPPALIVGAVGVANVMTVSVLERLSETGLRRAIGATRCQIRTQFLTEWMLLAVIGVVIGVPTGVAATAAYVSSKSWRS